MRVAQLLAGRYADVDVVVGYAYAGREPLAVLCKKQPGWRLYVAHAAPERLMAQAALGIGAGGGMAWERAGVGLATVVVGIAENQRDISEALAARGVVKYLGMAGEVGDAALLDAVDALWRHAELREAMARAGKALVDGKGALRVAMAMEMQYGRGRAA